MLFQMLSLGVRLHTCRFMVSRRFVGRHLASHHSDTSRIMAGCRICLTSNVKCSRADRPTRA